MQLQDLDVLKEIPGYAAILKAVLKSQIQMLVEQLSDQTGEESIILTASISDGTLCHLGSNRGKNFLDGREELKSQFLKHCLNTENKRGFDETTEVSPRPTKAGRLRPVSTPASSQLVPRTEFQHVTRKSIPSMAKRRKTATITSESESIVPDQLNQSLPISKRTDYDTEIGSVPVKLEYADDSLGDTNFTINQNTDDTVAGSNQAETSGREAEKSNHTETDTENESTFDKSEIKVEPVNQEELDLEITGVEMGGGGLVYDTSASELPTETGDASNQSESYRYMVDTRPADQTVVQLPTAKNDYSVATQDEVLSMRIYACSQCPKKFYTRQNLQTHFRIHTGEKPYTCQVCNKSFRQSTNLRTHERKLHPDTFKAFACPVCKNKFMRKRDMLEHQNRWLHFEPKRY